MILDSNIVIYIAQPKELIPFFENKILYVSLITKLEVLGFHKISKLENDSFRLFFETISIIKMDEMIIDKAIELRQTRKMSLGDSIIASTALIHNLPLVTANIDDFKWIEELELINPFIK